MVDFYDGMTTEAFLEIQAMAYKGRPHINSREVWIDGIKFASGAEGRYYEELKLLQRAGHIQHLQPSLENPTRKQFISRVSSRDKWKRVIRKRVYTPDFYYWDVSSKRWVAAEVKGSRTTQKGNIVPNANDYFYLRWDTARLAYPDVYFEIVIR